MAAETPSVHPISGMVLKATSLYNAFPFVFDKTVALRQHSFAEIKFIHVEFQDLAFIRMANEQSAFLVDIGVPRLSHLDVIHKLFGECIQVHNAEKDPRDLVVFLDGGRDHEHRIAGPFALEDIGDIDLSFHGCLEIGPVFHVHLADESFRWKPRQSYPTGQQH